MNGTVTQGTSKCPYLMNPVLSWFLKEWRHILAFFSCLLSYKTLHLLSRKFSNVKSVTQCKTVFYSNFFTFYCNIKYQSTAIRWLVNTSVWAVSEQVHSANFAWTLHQVKTRTTAPHRNSATFPRIMEPIKFIHRGTTVLHYRSKILKEVTSYKKFIQSLSKH